ncbi:MAG: RidA family protein [Chloroflexi bacterium]|nr:RidA family protein [Chloroflexota bacterium]MBM3173011.1 RidA family protein [Chloroflexota bacterium]MBM3174986.1 RidA family protein [Chloroflexota bacterium]MBM4449758.1 RidA family protein [Chloroflexota bacterium]
MYLLYLVNFCLSAKGGIHEKITYEVAGLIKDRQYSHVVEAGGFLFASGMIPIDIDKGIAITDNIRQATEMVLNNVKKVLAAVGSNPEKVVRVTVFLRNKGDLNSMNKAYRIFFSDKSPARSCVAANGIPSSAPNEVEVIAVKVDQQFVRSLYRRRTRLPFHV